MKQGLDDFVVESTPVLDLKKQSIDSTPPTQHISEPGWDADRTEVYADIDESDAIASLTADSGETYPITTFPFVIGRGSECDLVLQGKGISRKHVEIVFQSGRFVVNDLESLNGLKVNGYKVARVILEEQDTIKLGDVSLIFTSGHAQSDESEELSASEEKPKGLGLFGKAQTSQGEDDTFGPSPAKKMVTNMIIMLAVAIFAGAGYLFLTKPAATNVPVVSSSAGIATQKPAQPSTAAPATPTPTENTVATSQPKVAAAPTNTAPPPPPSFAPPPSIGLAPAKPVASNPPPATPKPAAVAPKPVSKPPAKPKTINLNDKAQVAISRAERLYFNGDGPAALKALKPYIGSTAVTGSTKRSVVKNYQDIEFLYGQYTEGKSAFDRGDKDSAFSLWTAFMAKEEQLFSGKRSTYTKQIANKVVDEYVNRGNIASKNEDYHAAYKHWQKAVDLGDSSAAKIALDNLHTRAQQLYRQALRLEYVNSTKAKAMWREVTNLLPPGTDYHTKASAKLAWYEKWGS